MTQTLDFERLMTEVAAGSEDAIWELAETYTPYIIRAVRASLPPKVRSKLDSQDFAQTLWASLLMNRSGLERLKTPEQLIAFLARATKNKVVDATRRYLHTQKYDVLREKRLAEIHCREGDPLNQKTDRALCTSDPTPSQFASVRERWNRVVASASERDRKILRLLLQGREFPTIAGELQIDQTTARRAIDRLFHQLSK